MIKRNLRVIGKIAAIIVLLFIILVLFFSIPAVQTLLGQYVTNQLNEEFKTNIFVEKVGLQFNLDVELKGILIQDFKQNDLIVAKELNTSILNIKNLYDGKLNFGDIDIETLLFHIRTYKGETESNLDIFVARFDEDNPTPSTSKFLLSSSDVTFTDSRFIYTDDNLETPRVLDFTNLELNGTNFLINGSDVETRINTLAFNDSRGLRVDNLMANFKYTINDMVFKNLKIKTPNSQLKGDLKFLYNREDLKYFVDKVNVEANFIDSKVDLNELNVFYNEFGKNQVANFNANFSGTLNNLNVSNVDLTTNKNTIIKGDIVFENLFSKAENDFKMIGDFKQLSSNYSKLNNILPNVLGASIPEIFTQLGNFTISGTSTITTQNIITNLVMNTDIGLVKTDLVINNANSIENATYKGNLVLKEFNLGALLSEKLLQTTNLNVDIYGKGFKKENLVSNLKGQIKNIVYNNYSYENLTVNGKYAQSKFNGELVSNDKNLKLDFKGIADFSKHKNYFNFVADVGYANLRSLNFYNRDNTSVFKGVVDIEMTGSNVDDVIGDVSFYDTTYTNENDDYQFKDFKIRSQFIENERLISINSPDIIEGELRGQFKFKDLPALFENSLMSIYTNYKPIKLKTEQYLDFNFKIYNKVVEVFFPEVKLGKNTFVKGKVENNAKAFKLTFKSPRIKLLDYFATQIEVQVDNSNPLFNTYIEIDSLNTKFYNISKFNLINVTVSDTLYIRSDFTGGKQNKDKFDLSLYYTLDENNKSVLGFKNSDITYNNTKWAINKNSNRLNNITFDRDFKNFDLKEFLISHKNQEVKLYGLVKEDYYKDLKLNFKNVELGKLIPEIDSVTFAGTIDGKLDWFQNKKIYKPNADLTINQLKINNQLLGDFVTKIEGNNSLSNYKVFAKIKNDQNNTFVAKGLVDISDANSYMDLKADFNKFSLEPLNPFLEDVLNDVRGFVNGQVNVTGKASKPSFNGQLKINEGGLGVPELNVDFKFQEKAIVELYDQTFNFKNINFTDTKEKTKGLLKGTISHVNFNKWSLNLDISTNRLLILDTDYSEDSIYYGTGYISGNAQIFGPAEGLTIKAEAKTEPGTVFNIPLNDNESFGDNSFIHFLSKEEKEAKEKGIELTIDKTKGLEMDFDLDITEDAEISIVIDKSSGSTITGRGAGSLLFDINTNGKFNMYGDFVIYKGDYNFLYAGLVEKKFIVEPYVSTLAWNGEPFDALINIKAIYKTRANPSPLLDNPINRSIPVELELELTDRLEKPEINYQFNFPTVESTIKSELNYRLDSKEERENQALFLLASGSFNSGFANVNISGTLTERLNGLINGIFSDQDNKLQLGLNYEAGQNRPDYQTDNRVGVTLQTKLTDRILINGKVGVPVGGASESVIAGDVQVDFILNEDGTLTAKVFNRENSIRNFGEEIGYTQGVGISYNVDFDTFGELLRKIFISKKKREEEDLKKQEEESKASEKDNPLPDGIIIKPKK